MQIIGPQPGIFNGEGGQLKEQTANSAQRAAPDGVQGQSPWRGVWRLRAWQSMIFNYNFSRDYVKIVVLSAINTTFKLFGKDIVFSLLIG